LWYGFFMSGATKSTRKRSLIFFVGRDSYFLSHRLPTARAAIAQGYDVHVIAGDSGLADSIAREGVTFHPRWFQEDRILLLSIFSGLIQLLIKGFSLRAKTVQVVGLRYALIGLLSSIALPWTRFIFSINGLGFLFLKEKPKFHHLLMRRVVMSFFTIIATIRAIDITFQNEDDLQRFVDHTTLRQARIHLIRGSGVDVNAYSKRPLPEHNPITFGMASRMIRMKGALDIIKAFRQLIDEGVKVKLLLAGDVDQGNPDSLKAEEITAMCCDGEIEWFGYQDDVRPFWENCHVAMLGSHGGEGLPMSLMIPAMMGRPILCSDTNGNRDLVNGGQNGYLFPAGDVAAIKTAVKTILENDLEKMGGASRALIFDRKMDADAVYEQFLELYSR